MPENKGRVLYIGGFELPDRNAAAHRVLNNAKILKRLGYGILFCGVDSEIKEASLTPQNINDFESIPRPYPASTKQWIKQMCDISVYAALLEKYSDIKYVFAYNLHALPLAQLLRLCRKKGVKVVADCTEWYPYNFSLSPIRFIKWLDVLLYMRVFHKKCDGMIAISTYLADYYKKHIKNIIVLPPLVDLSDEKYQGKGQKNDVITMVYSGSPAASKESLGEVITALDSLNGLSFKFNVVGITADQFYKIYGFVPNNAKIEFLGRVSHTEALNAVKAADYSVVVRPKLRMTMAGFPTKFAEAISCGTAVIANDTSDLANYLKDGKNGHVVRLESLREDMLQIVSSNEIPPVDTDAFDYKNWISDFEAFLNNF